MGRAGGGGEGWRLLPSPHPHTRTFPENIFSGFRVNPFSQLRHSTNRAESTFKIRRIDRAPAAWKPPAPPSPCHAPAQNVRIIRTAMARTFNNYSSPSLDVGIYLATPGNQRSTWATLIGPEAKPGTVHVPNNASPQRPLPAFTVVTDPGLQPRSFLTIKTAASTGPPSYRTKADKNMWLLVVRPPRRPLLQRKYRRRRRRRLFRREKRLRK